MRVVASIFLLFLLPLAGCGTLFGDTSQMVTFTSRPEGAVVMLDAKSIGRTPIEYEVSKKALGNYRVTITQPGYESQVFTLSKSLDTIALLNCTSWLSWGTDALTGGMIEYDPQAYFIELKPSMPPAAPAAPATPAGPSEPTLPDDPTPDDPTDDAMPPPPPPESSQLPIEQRRELAFVLGTHRAILVDAARGEGEYLRALATVMRVPDARYPDFVAAVTAELPVLLNERYPHRMYGELVRIVERAQLSTATRLPMFVPSRTLLAG